MAKKKSDETSAVGNFDLLSDETYVASLSDAGSGISEDSAHIGSESTEDAQADKILAAASKQQKQAVSKEKNKEEKEESSEEEINEEEEKTDDLADAETNESDSDSEETEEAEKKDESKDDVDDEKPLTFDDAESLETPQLEKNGWQDVAKELFDEELETDDFDAFKQKITEKTEYNLAKFKPETQRLIKFTEAGGTVDDFMEPLSKIDATIALPAADLVDRHLKATGWADNAKREAKLTSMAESGELEVIHKQVVDHLTSLRDEKKNDIINARIAAHEKHEAKLANIYKDEAKKIKSALSARKDFMGTELKPENIDKIVKKYEAGEYEPLLKDSNFMADFLLYKEYGKKGQENLKTKIEREFKAKHKEKFHNLPPKTAGKAGSVRATSSGQAPEGNWDLLEKERV